MPKQSGTKKPVPKLSPRIVRALFDTVINPLLRALPQEYELLSQRNWTWRFRAESLELIRAIPLYVDDLTRDNLELFGELYPAGQKYFDTHDKGVGQLVMGCSECHAEVKASRTFIEIYERVINPAALIDIGIENVSTVFGAYPVENHLDVLAEQVVNNTGSLPAYYPISRLWNRYREEFLNVLAEPAVRVSYDKVLKAGQEIRVNTLPLLTYLKQRRLELSLKYGEPYAALTAPAEVSSLPG
jgi:hypothetical protein